MGGANRALSVVLSFTARFPSEPIGSVLIVSSHRTEELSWQMRPLDMHQEARFQTTGYSEVFQSDLGDTSYPEMYFWKERDI